MYKELRTLAVFAIATMGSSIGSQAQNFNAGATATRTPGTRPPTTGPAIAGTWSGTVIQVQRTIEFTVTLQITAREAQISYPELHCGGKLSHVGASGDYSFFVETITRGAADDDGRCSNGTVTMARAGDDLAWGWFGLVKGEIVVAHGTLTRKSDANQEVRAEEQWQSTTGTTGPIPLPPMRKQRPSAKPPAARPMGNAQ
jgi:hypothetical protein